MANLGGLCPPTVSHIDTPTGRPPAALRLPFHIRSNICKILCRSRHYGRSTLYRLALSCKGYTNPALDILWAYMEGLEPLLNLMYSFNIQRDWRTGRITSVSSTEYNADDWHRFDTYATRVHWVDCIHDSVLDHLEGHIIRVIISHRPERNFLPNLRVLEWIHDDDKAITGAAVSLWSSILVPSLEHVDLHGMCDERRSGDIWSPQRDEALVSILESLPKRLPNLKWLRIHGNMAQCPIDFLQHFERLEFLNIRHILMDEDPIQPEPDTLTTLGIGLRKLKFLSLCIYRLGPDEVYGSDLFPSLEFLSLRATPVNVAGAIVNALGTTSLRVLKSSNHDDPVRSDELYDLLDSLSDRFAATLTTVHITMFGIKYLSEDDEAGSHLCSNASGSALMDTLRPLLDLPELRSVKLVVRPGWYNAHTVVESKCDQASLEDDDIRDMMLAWPKVERFSLLLPFNGLTVNSLIQVAMNAPNLKVLRLWSIEIPSGLNESQVPPVCLPMLRTLQIRYHDRGGSSDRGYASLLYHAFPNVIVERPYFPKGVEASWDEMQDDQISTSGDDHGGDDTDVYLSDVLEKESSDEEDAQAVKKPRKKDGSSQNLRSGGNNADRRIMEITEDFDHIVID